jgi:hypothetical protein
MPERVLTRVPTVPRPRRDAESAHTAPAADPDRQQLLRLLTELLGDLKYGQVLITVHDSRIVQVEKTERLRFN